MNKLKMSSKNMIEENVDKIAKLFPNVITEIVDENGNIRKAIDKELLLQELSHNLVDNDKKKYQFIWPGKMDAILTANTPIMKTLRPIREESLDWSTTKNIYIEGDNLEALKILQKSYLDSIKLIYIDPPYNTGHDLIYKDDFRQEKECYLKKSGQVDEYGNRLFKNTEFNGRFHSDWLTMMYPRLKLARNLLSENGIIFISIDDNEVYNLKKICDEIFGERNFVANIIRKTGATRAMAKYFDIRHDYILTYAKNISKLELNELPNEKAAEFENWDNDPKGPWDSQDLTVRTGGYEYAIPSINNEKKFVRRWRYPEWLLKKKMGFDEISTYEEIYKHAKYIPEKGWYTIGEFVFKGENKIINQKKYTSKVLTMVNHTLPDNIGSNKGGGAVLRELFGTDYDVFDNPKPVELVKYLIFIGSEKDSTILDFFSGSSTTAHAVMELNAKDGGKRKYIMVQLPESIDEKFEAYKAGYKNIAEIGKERIRRAGNKIKEQTGANIDYGFRVFKVDSSNMKDVYYPDKFESNIKEDRTNLDLLIQAMLELGLELSLSIELKDICGKKVYFVAGNSLVACFDKNVDMEILKEIAKCRPSKAVFRDDSFTSYEDKIDLEKIFKTLSPDTEVKVI